MRAGPLGGLHFVNPNIQINYHHKAEKYSMQISINQSVTASVVVFKCKINKVYDKV